MNPGGAQQDVGTELTSGSCTGTRALAESQPLLLRITLVKQRGNTHLLIYLVISHYFSLSLHLAMHHTRDAANNLIWGNKFNIYRCVWLLSLLVCLEFSTPPCPLITGENCLPGFRPGGSRENYSKNADLSTTQPHPSKLQSTRNCHTATRPSSLPPDNNHHPTREKQ